MTQRVGALHDHYLARDRPLGASRLLWEIGERGCDVRAPPGPPRARCRLREPTAAALESEGLIEVVPARARPSRPHGPADPARSCRTASCSTAAAMPWPPRCSNPCHRRNVTSWSTRWSCVDRLLTAALVRIDVVDPADGPARACLQAYFAELDDRFDTGFDPAVSLFPDVADMRPPRGSFVVAQLHGDAIGCGGVKWNDGAPAYIKRMWVAPAARGLVGRAPAAARAGVAGGRPRRRRRPARDEPRPDRGDRAVPIGGVRRGAAVQRRAVRPPLVPQVAALMANERRRMPHGGVVGARLREPPAERAGCPTWTRDAARSSARCGAR